VLLRTSDAPHVRRVGVEVSRWNLHLPFYGRGGRTLACSDEPPQAFVLDALQGFSSVSSPYLAS